jgi:hypothetical protein
MTDGRAQGGDPVQPDRLQVRADARRGDNTTVADEDRAREGKALLDLGYLVGQRPRIGGIAVEHLDGDRAAVAVTQQAVQRADLVDERRHR